MRIFKIFTNQYFYLAIILILGFLVRLYKIDSPIADWHSWRQADTAAVTRNFVKLGFNPFLPKFDDMSGMAEKPITNLGRFRFVEFPIYNMAVYPLYFLFGVNETYHRLVSVIFSLGSIVFLFLLTRKYTGIVTAQITALTFALLPFNVFFSRTTLPEPTFVFFALGMIYFNDRWIWESKRVWGVWGFIFTALAFLIKPWAIFFYLPLLYSALKKGKIFKKFIVFSVVAILPFLLWRLWILQQPEGIPASSWLYNGDGIRFRPAFFWWIISNRLGTEILTAAGIGLFLLGLITKPKNGNYFLHFWALSSFLFITIFATGNVRHNYYQILFIPVAALFLSQGFIQLIRGNSLFLPRIWTIPIGLLLFSLTFYFGWKEIKGLYQINNPAIVEAGKMADKILPKDAVVLAPYNGDTAFLYQTNRAGWPFVVLPITDMIADYGVTSYVSTTLDAKTKWIMRHFKVLEQKDNYVIVDLTTIVAKLDFKSDPEQ